MEAGSLQGVSPNLWDCMLGLCDFETQEISHHLTPCLTLLISLSDLVYFVISGCFMDFSAHSCALFSPLHLGCFEERSLTVKFRCGNEELLEVTEPSRCAYEARMALWVKCDQRAVGLKS